MFEPDTELFLGAFGAEPSGLDAGGVHGIGPADPLAVVRAAFPPVWAALDDEPLAQAMARHALAMRFSWFEVLEGIGVGRDVLGVMGAAAALGRARAIERDGRWQDQRDGVPRLIVPVWQDGALVDLCALNSASRGQWSLLTGDGLVLGLNGAPPVGAVRLFGNPLAWLAGGCAGICVLRWGAEALALLRSMGSDVTLLADDGQAAAKLADLLRWAGLPGVAPAEMERQAA